MAAKLRTIKAKGKAAALLDKLGGNGPSERVPVTLSLNKNSYERVTAICESKGIRVSHLVDELLAGFLEEVDPATS